MERTHNIPQEQVFQRYKDSIHGERLFKKGLVVTAVCTSCHTGHNVLPHTDPRSTIHKDNVVATCSKCHGLIEEVHRKVIAGALWERQGVIPICVECHSPHEARKVFYDTNMWGLAISSDDKSFVYNRLRIKRNLPAVPEVARKCKPTCRCRGRRPFAG